MPPSSSVVRVVHFNDVYNVQPGALEPVGGAARFVNELQRVTRDAACECLVLFSGDAFSPAPLTRFTAGAEIPPVLNACRVDVACIGNHELDNGLAVMQQRVAETNFPWLLSNVWHKQPQEEPQHPSTNRQNTPLAGLQPFHTLTKGGVKFGFIGLASWQWLCAVSQQLLDSLRYVPFLDAAREMACVLRRDHGCHFVVALTHMTNPDDVLLAQAGVVDLILGGHDHVLFKQLVASTWILKSGTDFKNYSTVDLYVSADHKIHVSEPVHHYITSDLPEHPRFAQFVAEKVALLGPRWTKCVALSSSPLDGRFVSVRTRETALGNFICDAMTTMMDADIGLVNSGSFRSDSMHPPGSVTLGMIDTILPYKDQVVVAEYSGAELLQRLECSVSQYPHLVGGFCQVSGISFSFDPRLESGSRILRDTVMCTNSEGAMMPMDDRARYRCAIKSWIFCGNDGFPCSEDSKIIRHSEYPLPQLVAKYIAQVKTVADEHMPHVSPQVEDRIQCVCPDETLLQAYRRL